MLKGNKLSIQTLDSKFLYQFIDTASSRTLSLATSQILTDEVLNARRLVCKSSVILAKSVGHEQVPAIYDQVLGDFYFKK